MGNGGLHRRYVAGQREQVWRELRQVGGQVRDDPDLASEAQLVCDEMAVRARQNIQELVERLSRSGYHFHSNDDMREAIVPHMAPTDEVDTLLPWLESSFGALPMALMSWMRIVGDVWLVGTHPDWPTSVEADPFAMELEGALHPDWPSMRSYFEGERDCWFDSLEQDDGGLFVLPVAPDRLHKANTSGGAPYGFFLPDRSAEGLFRSQSTTPFVEYLNHVFANGGFPHCTELVHGSEIRHNLASGLLPL
jgi:hypothetical protein